MTGPHVARLQRFGYLPASPEGAGSAPPTAADVAAAVARYKQFMGLPAEATPEQVAKHLALPRCGCPDFMPAGLARWPTDGRTPVRLAVWHNIALAGYSEATVNRAFEFALTDWRDRTNIDPWLSSGRTQPTPLNVLCAAYRIDGPGSILAQCELPYDGIRLAGWPPLSMAVDSSEPWAAANYGEDYLRTVLVHEFGHAWGLGHAPMGTGAVMEPYAVKGRRVTAHDAREMEARYGPYRKPNPTPNPTPQPGPGGTRLYSFREEGGATVELWRRA